MDEISDNDLVRDYASRNSEAAFEALVARHIDLVYSAAIRQVGNEEAAKEVTQITFALLARKAAHLPRGISVAGWLYRTARFAALTELRAARRRAHYEREAQMQAEAEDRSEPESTWVQVGPMLDELLSQLGSCDREAVVLRFFKEKSLTEVGLALWHKDRIVREQAGLALRRFAPREMPVLSGF